MEIGAFRTYPEGYTPPEATPSEYQPIPLNKIEDFGVHADMYYTLDVSIFKTSLDSQIIKLLWNKYWSSTLSASPLLSNDGFIGGQLEDLGVHPSPPSCCLCNYVQIRALDILTIKTSTTVLSASQTISSSCVFSEMQTAY